jgi:hypothetical protein
MQRRFCQYEIFRYRYMTIENVYYARKAKNTNKERVQSYTVVAGLQIITADYWAKDYMEKEV